MTEPKEHLRTADLLGRFRKELHEARISENVADQLVLHAGKLLIDDMGLAVGK